MRRALVLLATATACLSCADNSRFSLEDGWSYCGVVTSASFVRAGMDDGTRMRLKLNPESLQVDPGTVWTDHFLDGDFLSGSKLRVINQLLGDPLSTFTFGEGRVKNAMLIANLRKTQGQVLVVVSLLQSGEVEVRLIRGASPANPKDPGIVDEPQQLFGVFLLHKEKGDCGIPSD